MAVRYGQVAQVGAGARIPVGISLTDPGRDTQMPRDRKLSETLTSCVFAAGPFEEALEKSKRSDVEFRDVCLPGQFGPDPHAKNFAEHKDRLLPPADKAYAALIEDLDERGLLDSTLVVALGEFGRTPKINANAGRDHWPDCYSITLAGGGIRGGTVFGASDQLGAYPAVDPVTPANLAATIFWRFGLNPRAEIYDQTGRPHRLADGKQIRSLFA